MKKIKTGEIWRDIPGYKGYYQASSIGRVKSLDRPSSNPINKTEKGIVLKPSIKRGYDSYVLQKDGKRKYLSCHRIVAITFIPNPNNLPQVNHINGVKADNNVDNLEWCTAKHNINHAWDTGLSHSKKGSLHHNSILKEADILKIRRLFGKKSSSKIGELFNVTRGCIESIKHRRTWVHVK